MKFYQWLLLVNNVGLWVFVWIATSLRRVRVVAHPDGHVEYIGTLNKLRVNDTVIEEVEGEDKAKSKASKSSSN